MRDLLNKAREHLRKQLYASDTLIALERDEAEAILAGPTDPVAVLDEIGRLALIVSKEQVESYAEAGGMKPRHRRFTCKCGTDWMTVLPGVDTCQVCYRMDQPDIEDWIKGALRCDVSSSDCNGGENGYCHCRREETVRSTHFTCPAGKRVPIGKPCPHCGARPAGENCRFHPVLTPRP